MSRQHANTPVDMPLLSMDNIGFELNGKTILKNVRLSIRPFEVISLIGPNGAGKSTLVKIILGLIKPSEGTITQPQKNMVIGYVPQKFSVVPVLPLRVRDLLAQALKNRLSHDEKQQIITTLTLDTLLDAQVATLSGGELQRVLLAKALMDKPDLLVLDEPMQGLDPEAQNTLYALIDSLPKFLHCAMLVVSHDLHWVMKGTKHVICLNKHICCQGLPTDIKDTPEFLALFGGVFGDIEQHIHETPYIHHHHHCQHHQH